MSLEAITDYLELTNLGLSDMDGERPIIYYHNQTVSIHTHTHTHTNTESGWLCSAVLVTSPPPIVDSCGVIVE